MQIYCDGCCNGESKGYGWGTVFSDKNEDLILRFPVFTDDMKMIEITPESGRRKGQKIGMVACKFDDVVQQNNGAELLAFIVALRIANLFFEQGTTVYTDSQLVFDYWSLGRHKIVNPEKVAWIKIAMALRKEFEGKGGKIVKIPGAKNIADPGWH